MQHGKMLARKPNERYVANSDGAVSIPEKKEVSAVERWCHRFGDDHDDGNVRSRGEAAAFPGYEQVADGE
jgi:hypothetical protein